MMEIIEYISGGHSQPPDDDFRGLIETIPEQKHAGTCEKAYTIRTNLRMRHQHSMNIDQFESASGLDSLGDQSLC
jgi:hypothetical protein